MRIINRSLFILIVSAVTFISCVAGCNKVPAPSGAVQGYVEGEFVYVAAPLSGTVEKFFVRRGAEVKAGDPLFEQDNILEKSARDETKFQLTQLRAQLADAKKGKRPTEIESSTAQLNLSRTALQFSEKELVRQEKLLAANIVPAQEVDRMRSLRDQERQRVAQLEAELGSAKLGARSDQIAAIAANIRAQEAVLARSEWELARKRQTAPQAGLVFDTLYRNGEWIAAGRPAVVLLPPQNIKVRAFAAQPLIATIHQGDKARVTVDGMGTPFFGTVTFISPQAEYTPPVIYSRENRQKLVYMVELGFDQAVAIQLHPGQPVDVHFGTAQ